jgi:hypothetical protein
VLSHSTVRLAPDWVPTRADFPLTHDSHCEIHQAICIVDEFIQLRCVAVRQPHNTSKDVGSTTRRSARNGSSLSEACVCWDVRAPPNWQTIENELSSRAHLTRPFLCQPVEQSQEASLLYSMFNRGRNLGVLPRLWSISRRSPGSSAVDARVFIS